MVTSAAVNLKSYILSTQKPPMQQRILSKDPIEEADISLLKDVVWSRGFTGSDLYMCKLVPHLKCRWPISVNHIYTILFRMPHTMEEGGGEGGGEGGIS